jgi:hypothetical protein
VGSWFFSKAGSLFQRDQYGRITFRARKGLKSAVFNVTSGAERAQGTLPTEPFPDSGETELAGHFGAGTIGAARSIAENAVRFHKRPDSGFGGQSGFGTLIGRSAGSRRGAPLGMVVRAEDIEIDPRAVGQAKVTPRHDHAVAIDPAVRHDESIRAGDPPLMRGNAERSRASNPRPIVIR